MTSPPGAGAWLGRRVARFTRLMAELDAQDAQDAQDGDVTRAAS